MIIYFNLDNFMDRIVNIKIIMNDLVELNKIKSYQPFQSLIFINRTVD